MLKIPSFLKSVALVVGVVALTTGDARAQEMPAWAAPSQRAPIAVQSPTAADAPTPPDNGPPVPVDGGLFGLALVGAGYAIRRLRKEAI